MKKECVTIAAVWKVYNGLSIKLNNGEYIGVWKNQEKTKENRQPDFKITMSEEFATKLKLIESK